MPRNVAREVFVRLLLPVIAGIVLVAAPQTAPAGGGPENVLLVVNAESHASKTIANHYVKAREIPPGNVLYLNGIPPRQSIAVEQFRRRILQPILTAIEKRKLQEQIDYIVYSDGFPTRIAIAQDTTRDPAREFPSHFRPFASINSLTYFAEQVVQKRSDYHKLDSNRYMRVSRSLSRVSPFSGALAIKFLDGVRQYGKKQYADAEKIFAEIIQAQPDQALLHVMRAAALAAQNKQDEAVASLREAIAHDWADFDFLSREPSFAALTENREYQELIAALPRATDPYLPTTPFEHKTIWATNGLYNSTPDQGERYYLSTLLAASHSQGLSLAEHLEYLDRAVKSDATTPSGSFYFASTRDVRTRARAKQFSGAMAVLKEMGYPSAVVTTWAPMGRRDILGLSFGVARYNWSKTQSRFLPGAIGECLTSAGGNFANESQTPLTEMLRAGAAGSSGTVAEPYAIHQKFPHAMMYIHYVRGASLAEAYYQSVHAPYQLLIVGDALCQPWAKPVSFEVRGITAGDKLDSPRELEFAADEQANDQIAEFRVFVDGVHRGTTTPGKSFRLAKQKLGQGVHELRVVAVRRDNVASQSRKTIPFEVGESAITLRADPIAGASGREITVRASWIGEKTRKSPSIVLYQNARKIGTFEAPDASLQLDRELLGSGPVQLRARAVLGGQATWSPPLWLDVP